MTAGRTARRAMIDSTNNTLQGVRDAMARSNDQAVAADSRQNVLHDAVQALARGTEDFAARRMDKSVRKVLAGKALDQV
jgi:molecular chaperone HscA